MSTVPWTCLAHRLFCIHSSALGEVFNTLTGNKLTVVFSIYLKFNLCISSDTKKGRDLKFCFGVWERAKQPALFNEVLIIISEGRAGFW